MAPAPAASIASRLFERRPWSWSYAQIFRSGAALLSTTYSSDSSGEKASPFGPARSVITCCSLPSGAMR